VAKSAVTVYRFGEILMKRTSHDQGSRKKNFMSVCRLEDVLTPIEMDIKPPNINEITLVGDFQVKDEDEKKKKKNAEYKKQLELFNKRLANVDSLRGGTNIGGSACKCTAGELSHIQAIIVISTGSRTSAAIDARSDFKARVDNPAPADPGHHHRRRTVSPAGQHSYRRPQRAGRKPGRTNRSPFSSRHRHRTSQPEFRSHRRGPADQGRLRQPCRTDRKRRHAEDEDGQIQSTGDHPRTTSSFEIDVQELKGIKAKDDAKADRRPNGNIWAKVPRHKDEAAFTDPFT